MHSRMRDYRRLPWAGAALVLVILLVSGISESALATSGGFECEYVSPDTLIGISTTVPPPHIRSAVVGLRVSVLMLEDAPPNWTGGWNEARVDSQIARVRADFASSNIFFRVVDINFVEVDSSLYFSPSTYQLEDVCDMPDWEQSHVIQAVLASMPDGAERPAGTSWNTGTELGEVPTRAMVLATTSHSTPVLSHEIGHCFGLRHTQELVPGCGSLSSCISCGDHVCDTAYDPYSSGDLWQHVDPETCEYDGDIPGANPPVDNIMSYSRPACMEHFTPGQTKRMMSFLEYHELLLNYRQGSEGAYYTNKSSETELAYLGSPYSAAVLDYDQDGLKDLLISNKSDPGSLQRQLYLSQDEIPQFSDRTGAAFPENIRPQSGLRGLTVADYDNDGWPDVFAAADTVARLYRNTGGEFVDVASALGVGNLSTQSYAGAWADFDRDGQLDLFVCRAGGGGSDPNVSNIDARRGRLLRNDVQASGMFVDVTDSSGIGTDAMSAAVAASWSDINGDNSPDLLVGDLRGGAQTAVYRLFVNDGLGEFSEEASQRICGDMPGGINSVAWADMDNDGNMDAVIGSELADPTVLLNNGSGYFCSSEPIVADADTLTTTARPVDHDLDGRIDLFVLPGTSSGHPWVFWNQDIDGRAVLLDETYAFGLLTSTGSVSGVVGSDFNEDGDVDVYLGRPVSSGKYFYREEADFSDSLTTDWVGVRLLPGGGNNASAIGAKVLFSVGTQFQQLQIVDGGSGRGGQADQVLVCGLGAVSGTPQADVTWPGGYQQTVALARNQITEISDATVPGIVATSISGSYAALPGGLAELTFSWDTNYSCKPSLDKVTVTDPANQPPSCEIGTFELTPDQPGVEHKVELKAGGGYRHSMTWLFSCSAPCSYSYHVESATDSTHKSTSSNKRVTMGVCIDD